MTTITVVKTIEKESATLSKEEREVLFHELSEQLHISYIYFNALAGLEDLATLHYLQGLKQDLPVLALRQLLNFPGIVCITPAYNMIVQDVNSLCAYYHISLKKFGGAPRAKSKSDKPPPHHPTPEAALEAKHPQIPAVEIPSTPVSLDTVVAQQLLKEAVSGPSIWETRMQRLKTNKIVLPTTWSLKYTSTSERNVLVYLPDILLAIKDSYLMVPGDTINICGLQINMRQILKEYYIQQLTANMSIIGRCRSGYYNEEYLHICIFAVIDALTYFWTSNLTHIGFTAQKNTDYLQILFKNEAHAVSIIRLVFQLSIYLLRRVQADYITLFMSFAFVSAPLAPIKSKKKKDSAEQADSAKALSGQLFKMMRKWVLFKQEQPVLVKLQSQSLVVKMPAGTAVAAAEQKKWVEFIAPFIQEKNLGVLAINQIQKAVAGWEKMLAYDLWSMRLNHEWFRINYLIAMPRGANANIFSKYLTQSLGQLKQNAREKAQLTENAHMMRARGYEEMTYRWIYIKKFGFDNFTAKMAPLLRIASNYNVARQEGPKRHILDVIPAKERDIVLVEQKREATYFELMQSNQAPWVPIARALHYAIGLGEKRRLYFELKKYLPESAQVSRPGQSAKKHERATAVDWVRSPEGYPIICPHVRDEIEMELNGKTDAEIHEFLLRYAGRVPLYDAYYCSICGETLTYSNEMTGIVMFDGDQPIMLYHDSEEGLREYIWKIMNQILRSNTEFRDIKTSKFINQFISTSVDALYEFVVLIDKKIRQAKTSTIEEIENKRKFFSMIYIWALLVKIVSENSDRIRFTFQKGFKKTNTNILIDSAYQKILDSQNVLLRQLQSMNEDFVRESLLKAFTNINVRLTKSELEPPKPIDMSDMIIVDPIYKYILTFAILAAGKHKEISTKDLLTVLPKDIDETLSFWYEKVQPAALLSALTPTKSIWVAYATACFKEFMQYIQSRLYLTPVYAVRITKSPENDNLYHIQVDKGRAYQDFRTSLEPTLKLESQIQISHMIINLEFYGLLPYITSNQYERLAYPSLLLGFIYGQMHNPQPLAGIDGANLTAITTAGAARFHRHNWSIHVFTVPEAYRGPGGLANNKYKTSELKILTGKNSPAIGDIYVDNICSICKYSWSEVMNNTNIVKEIEEHDQIDDFFNYYQNRCPTLSKKQIKEGDYLHTFNAAGICQNCGATQDILTFHDKAYYNKYIEGFLKIIAHIHTEKDIFVPAKTSAAAQNLIITVPKEIKDWTYNNNILLEMVAKTMNKKWKKSEYYNIWLNLGLTEKFDYDKVLSGEEMPAKTLDTSQTLQKTRINRLDIYIKELIFDFYTLVNYKNISNLALDYKTILENLPAEKTNAFITLAHPWILPGGSTGEVNYLTVREEIEALYPNNALAISNFLLEYLVQNIFAVILVFEKCGKQLAERFTTYFINKIIHMERTTSKMKEQKQAAVEAAHKTAPEDNPNMQDNTQTHAYDDLVPANQVDNFSYEDIDYSGENDDK